jgi:hypothetical protein
MTSKISKFFARLYFTFLMSRRDRQVSRIFGQLNGQDAGFPFSTRAQMNQQTTARDLRALLDLIDVQAPEMGAAYGEAFRYLMHRDLYDQLELYVRHVQQRIPHKSRVPIFAN